MPNDEGLPRTEGGDDQPPDDSADEPALEADEAEDDEPVTTEQSRSSTREISAAQFKQILADHRKWLESDGNEGTRANFRKANLRRRHFWSVDLRAALFWKADISGASFRDANLQGADLRRANLKGASFVENVVLRDAQLQDAIFLGAKGLLVGQLAGANVSGAKLPDDIAKFEGLAHVTEISKHARNVFLAVVGGCVFSWLTIATTTDVALLTNSGSSPLPIIQTKVPIAGFYWAAPAILLALYAYLHLYLQRLWEGMASLPAIFPDGRTLDERAYPWLLSGIVRAHVPRLKDKPQARLGLQVAVSLVAAWMFVPGTLGLFWLRYLPRHDWPWTLWLVALFVVAVAFGTASYRLATTTLRGEPTTKPDVESEDEAATPTWKRAARVVRGYRPDLYSAIAAVLGLLISLSISMGAIQGRPDKSPPTYDFRTWVYTFAKISGYYPALEMVGEDVSFKPEDWSGLGKEPDDLSPAALAEVKGAQLADSDLEYARAFDAFFLKADLRDANLQGAHLWDANLQGANLRDASLKGANLLGANLQGANLWDANLQGADLEGASFKGANLLGADLQGAHLSDANLQGANLSFANLQGAELFRAILQGANLTRATGLTQDQLDRACGDNETKLPKKPEGLTIKLCSGLDLSGLDFRDFKGLTQAQLDESCGNDKTELPEGLKIDPCPDETEESD